MNVQRLEETVDSMRYFLLGVGVMTGTAGTVAGSRMIQNNLVPIDNSTGVPPGITLLIVSSVLFGTCMGYLITQINEITP